MISETAQPYSAQSAMPDISSRSNGCLQAYTVKKKKAQTRTTTMIEICTHHRDHPRRGSRADFRQSIPCFLLQQNEDCRNFGTPVPDLPTVTLCASVTRCAQREHVHQLVSCARAKIYYNLSWCWMSMVSLISEDACEDDDQPRLPDVNPLPHQMRTESAVKSEGSSFVCATMSVR
jgi:hypothetical protein